MPPAILPDVCGENLLIIRKRNGIIVAYDAHCPPEDSRCYPKEIIEWPPLRECDIASDDWILSEGNAVYWCNGEYKNDGDFTRVTFKTMFEAYSGYVDEIVDAQIAEDQWAKGFGPTVEGIYELNVAPNPKDALINNNGTKLIRNRKAGIESIPNEFGDDWGKKRIRLQPVRLRERNKNNVRDINSFYFHDSSKYHTRGCIEVESSFFDALVLYREKMIADKEQVVKINVIVEYPSKDHVTRYKLHEKKSE